MTRPVEFRNIARYVRDVAANVPLYQALGFEPVRSMGGMTVLKNGQDLTLILHAWDGHEGRLLDSAIGVTATGPIAEARRYLEEAGFTCLREPEEGDEGFFFIYGDLDGNPVNLVGQRPRPA